MFQIRDVFLGQTMCCSWTHVDRLVTRRIWSKHRAIYSGKKNCTRKQHALKAVVKVSRNIELYSCQTTHLKPKNSYQFSKSSNTNLDGLHQIKLDRWPRKRQVRSEHENEVEVRTDPITSPEHCATQRSLRPYILYFAVRSLRLLTVTTTTTIIIIITTIIIIIREIVIIIKVKIMITITVTVTTITKFNEGNTQQYWQMEN